MISDEEWAEFKEWYLSRYSFFTPDKVEIEIFLEWREGRKDKEVK